MKKSFFWLFIGPIFSMTSIFSSAIATTEVKQDESQVTKETPSLRILEERSIFSFAGGLGILFNISPLKTNDIFLGIEDVETYGASPQAIIELNTKYRFYTSEKMNYGISFSLITPLNEAKVIKDEAIPTEESISYRISPIQTTSLFLEKKLTNTITLDFGFGAMIAQEEVKNADYSIKGAVISNIGDFLASPYIEFGLGGRINDKTKLTMKIFHGHDFEERTFDNALEIWTADSTSLNNTHEYTVIGTLFSFEKVF